MALTKAKLMELIDNGDIDVGGGGLSPNLLHNWDFRNPVNQRGVSGAISTGTYFYDRWIRNDGTVTTNAAYLTINGKIEQRIEGDLLAGKIVTVSVVVGGTVYSGTGTFPTSVAPASVTLTGWGTAILGYAAVYMYVQLSPTAASNVQAVKLELGTVSTLHLDPPVDYGVELFKCQRYCKVFTASYRFYGVSHYAGGAVATLICPAALRVAPSYTDPGIGWRSNGANSTCALSSVTIVSGGLELWFTASGPPWFSPNHVCQFEFTAGIVFSADL